MEIIYKILLSLLLALSLLPATAQVASQERLNTIERRLDSLVKISPGLNEKAEFAVSGGSIQEFLRGIAEAHSLNISVEPQLAFKIYNNFTGEKVSTILLFLCKEYDLDIRFTGSILSFYKYIPPSEIIRIEPKNISIQYNTYNDQLSLELRNDTLSHVVKKIIQLSKKNIILSPDLADKKVNLYVESMLFENALEKLGYANNLKITKTEDQSYLIKALAEGEDLGIALYGKDKKNQKGTRKSATSGGQNNGNQNNFNGSNQNSTAVMNVELNNDTTKMLNVDVVDGNIQDIIKMAALETEHNYFIYSDLKGTTTAKLTNVTFDELLTYTLQSTDNTYKIEAGIYLIGDRKIEGLRAHKVYQFMYRSLDAVNEIIPAEIKKGVEIKEFKELNSILLSGSLPQINEILAFIKPLDRLVPMITIEVIVLDVKKGHSVKTGISAGIDSSATRSAGTIFPGIDFKLGSGSFNYFLDNFRVGGKQVFNIGKVSPNFYIGLSALEQNQDVEVRNMPKLSTLNGHDANLSIGSTRYYSLNTQNVIGSLNPQTVVTQQFQSVEANLAITIKPVVSGDDQVTLTIDVNISDFIGEATSGPPPTSKSQFKSMIRVKNEEMVVLGGIERYEKSKSGTGVPLLSRIPILKWLFSSRSSSKNKTVSIVFIKPTIIYQ